MTAAFRAQLLKLRKRPAVAILIVAMFAIVALFGYVALYVVATQAPFAQLPGVDRALLLTMVRRDALLAQVLGIVAGPGIAIAVILGALAVGAEFSWRTIATIATQGPQRLPLLVGHVLAVMVACAVVVGAGFAGGVAGAAIVALFQPAAGSWPAAVDVAAALGAGLLAVAVWCAVGMALAMLFRGTAWAVGIGLLQALAVESVLGLLPLAGGLGDAVARALIGTNVSALVVAAVPDAAATFGSPAVPIPVAQAVTVLLAYLLGALAVAAAVFVRRDIAT